jgi:hypothetical protein
MNGLLVLQAMLGNSDLKDQQNVVYTLKEPFEGAKQWYVARDLGQSFGRTGVLDAPRGDPRGVRADAVHQGGRHGHVQFDYRGRHRCSSKTSRPLTCAGSAAAASADRRSVARRVPRRRVSQRVADRFIRRMKQKIDEGLALKDS